MINKIFWLGALCLLLPSLLQAYLLMPFPFSQDFEAIQLSYFLQKTLPILRTIGLLSISYPTYYFLKKGSGVQKIMAIIIILLIIATYYFTDISYKAEMMFKEPKSLKFLPKNENNLPDSLLVLSVVNKGTAKAYPINFVGYHHKIQDTLRNLPLLVTYCTMCRTGMVFSPILNDKKQTFRLVGARHYNAILEDSLTKTWWYQATGEAAAGPLKGHFLATIAFEQMTLGHFFEQFPKGQVMQIDESFKAEYAELKNYDRRPRKDSDSLTNPNKFWAKSWVIGISNKQESKAYEWQKLRKISLLNDYFGTNNVLLVLEPDMQSFHVFDRTLNGKTLTFEVDSTTNGFRERTSKTLWTWQGECLEGENKGKKLTKIQASQEYWRAWKQFHPSTKIWNGEPEVLLK